MQGPHNPWRSAFYYVYYLYSYRTEAFQQLDTEDRQSVRNRKLSRWSFTSAVTSRS